MLVFQKDDFDTYTVKVSEVFNKKLKVVFVKTKEIEEVKIIPYTEEAYKNYIQYFLDTFIGFNQENVKIKNQRSLKFSYDKENKILKAKSPQTLRIENKSCGYIVDYNLVDFTAEFNNRITRFYGTSFFKENKNTNKMKLNRIHAFDGSQVHFFRSVFANTVIEDGFIVNQITKFPNPERKSFEPEYTIAITKLLIPESDYTKDTDGKLILHYGYMMQINYKKFYYEIKGKKFCKISCSKSTDFLSSSRWRNF